MPRSKKDVPRKGKSARAKTKTAKQLGPQSRKPSAKAAGKSRAEGIRLFTLAGRPSQQDFVKVYGPNGPKMTWEQRAKAGVPAEKFQDALVSSRGANDGLAGIHVRCSAGKGDV
jgi:hypothetical protein